MSTVNATRTITTGIQNRYNATMDIVESFAYMPSIIEVMQEVAHESSGTTKFKAKKARTALQNLAHTLETSMKKASSVSTSAVRYAYKRRKVVEQRELKAKMQEANSVRHSNAFLEVKQISSNTQASSNRAAADERRTILENRARRAMRRCRKLPSNQEKSAAVVGPKFPPPLNGMVYQPFEVVTLLQGLSPKHTSLTIRTWVANHLVGPKSKRQCIRFSRKHEGAAPSPSSGI
jgi:hypothetical protein